jgi:hypothetical protein
VRILIVSYYFPPYNASGAIRVGKTARYLIEFGHEVRVIAAGNPPLQRSLRLEIPEKQVIYTHWVNINAPAGLAIGGKNKVTEEGFARYAAHPGLLSKLGLLYKSILNFPDGKVGWIPFASGAGLRLCRQWRPDVIYASGMPFSSFVISAHLAARLHVPWTAEFRDLYVDDHYYPYPHWRRRLDAWIEQRVIQKAAGAVTVSEPLAEVLRRKYDKPTAVILNGFAPEDFPSDLQVPRQSSIGLRIVYTGTLTGLMYEVRRDPSPLFKAIRLLGVSGGHVRVVYYGRDGGIFRELAKKEGVDHHVDVRGLVPNTEALKAQMEADVLLLLLWNSPEEKGVYTGKLFEYLGARRPILAIGPPDNVATALIQSRGAGAVLFEPREIAVQLSSWLSQKQSDGTIPSLPIEVTQGLTRKEQTRKLEQFLKSTVK